ncbi:CsgE family curli-type amyloid fiber assembly protein [Zunongwangia sp. F363]|uniref:Curli production assembly/transport component CsgE n=1 Tax=Autumnicola tepida TaxID=3075595 RepID=A0ABU3CEC2_9FLAO|nr:CsgE family curli-type amyloid fiber assembly protein [Zunongwangia sp. F363]MDT0644608.1 CsgE family curli-type amyloid fiber assembly protein [Zunongwangia sp. F363]
MTIFISDNCFSQFYNKEIVAKIKVEDKGEFINFSATAENVTPAGRNLRYEFSLFKKDDSGNTTKSSQGNRFYLEPHQKEILSSTQVNRSDEGSVIILLLIYDQDDKPIGKDRLEFKITEESIQEIQEQEKQVIHLSEDQAKPQDGVIINGLIIENTITKAGRDFYRYFYSEYYNREIISPQNIEIEEVPGRGRMTRVSVHVGDQLVMQFFARPKKEYLKQMANVTLARVLTQIQRLGQQANNFKHY